MPYLGTTTFIVVLGGTALVSLVGFWLLVRALAPAFVGRASDRWEHRPVLTTLLGAVVGLVYAVLCGGLFAVSHPATSAVATVALTLGLTFAMGGATGIASRIGRGLSSPSDEGRPWFQTLKGGVVLELACLFPMVGWFVALPLTLAGGFGAALVGLWPATVAPAGQTHATGRAPSHAASHSQEPHAPAA